MSQLLGAHPNEPHVISGFDEATRRDATGRALDERECRLFRSLDLEGRGRVAVSTLRGALEQAGLSHDDPRLAKTLSRLAAHNTDDALDFDEFCETVRPSVLLVERALQGNLVIPCFDAFREGVGDLVGETLSNLSGDVASYIPQLARVDPDSFALAMCTVDGQRHQSGDVSTPFSIQSCCKPINYCLALEEHGEERVHALIGCEPNGGLFNELALTAEGRPHNPMINAGAILSSALIRPRLPLAERFEFALDRWTALSGGRRPGFSNAVYQSERRTADRNYAIAYYMREHEAFPPDVDMQETLELYFQCCSIELDANALSVVAATLANGGVCPFTGERLIQAKNVQNCLSLMCSCGMYDFSGEFAFTVGLPAKSGVSGAILVVVPNVLGFCVWSPRLDRRGNSVRGVEFCQRLVRRFNLHNFDSLTGTSEKTDPRLDPIRTKAEQVGELIWAASRGDLGAVQRLGVRGIDVNTEDYDRRTAPPSRVGRGQDPRGARPGRGRSAREPPGSLGRHATRRCPSTRSPGGRGVPAGRRRGAGTWSRHRRRAAHLERDSRRAGSHRADLCRQRGRADRNPATGRKRCRSRERGL